MVGLQYLLFKNGKATVVLHSPARFRLPTTDTSFYVPLLQAHLQSSSAQNTTEWALTAIDTNIIENAAILDSAGPSRKREAMLWTLIRALWGAEFAVNGVLYNEEIKRRFALSSWLQNVLKDFTPVPTDDDIFSLMACKRVPEAVRAAQRNKQYRLALLLTLADSNTEIRSDILAQVTTWDSKGHHKFIEPETLRLYRLIGGDVTHASVVHGLSWLHCFALQLWYCSPRNRPIQEAVVAFQKSLNVSKSVPEPLSFADPKYPDTLYTLLALFSNTKFPVEPVVHPQGVVAIKTDFQSSWHLLSVLLSLGYKCELSYQVTSSFAAQLEAAGLWTWAVYIYLHLTV